MTGNFCFHEKLVVVTHVVHYKYGGRLYAYAPYAREIEVWADMFEEVLIAAPCHEADPPGDCAPIESTNLDIAPQREFGGETLAAKAKLLLALPLLCWDLTQAMRQGDAIQVRCPGNLGLVGSALAPLFSKHLVAKFAGQWNATPGEPLSNKLQRAIFRSKWWGSPVTVYGKWPGEPDHIVPFFNSIVTDHQIARSRTLKRGVTELRNVLFVGRLSKAKNVDVLLRALGILHEEGIGFTATIAGEGPERTRLEQLSISLGLRDSVEFSGGVSFARIVELMERSGVLVLVSETEGWPKAIVEGMTFGLIAVGSHIGLVPQILGEGRGFAVPPRDIEALAGVLRKVLAAPDGYSEMRLRASTWGAQYSIESLHRSLRSLLATSWGVKLAEKMQSETVASPVCIHD